MTVSTEDLMTAIVALKGHLDGRIDGLRTELKGDIARLDDKIDTKIDGLRTELKGDIAKVDTKIDGLRTELKGDIAGLRTELKGAIAEHRAETRTEARGVQARLDDQSRMLAAMIPTHLAAVPPRNAA